MKKYQKKYKQDHKVIRSYHKPEKTMCKCPMCEKIFQGSAYQGKYSYCDACARMVRGIEDTYRLIGRMARW
jgi:acetyl-CoA carboxylase beta subunit